MSVTSTGVETMLPTDLDPRQARDLERALGWAGHATGARLVSAAGESYPIPDALCSVLARVVHELAAGNSVTVAPATKELTTQQAAEVLQVSRPYLVRLLEEGMIPFRRVGTHRRVELADAVAYKEQQTQQRRTAMEKLAALSIAADLDI